MLPTSVTSYNSQLVISFLLQAGRYDLYCTCYRRAAVQLGENVYPGLAHILYHSIIARQLGLAVSSGLQATVTSMKQVVHCPGQRLPGKLTRYPVGSTAGRVK